MPTLAAENLLKSKTTQWFVGALTFALFAISNLPWQLDDYDQAKQAFTSFEMVKEGHFFYQRTPNEKVATKPPLAGWISAGLFGLTRSWALAWRLPSFLSAIAIGILLKRTATKAFGEISGFLAMGAFALNLLSLRLSTLVRTDMPLALVTFLIGWQIWNKIRNEESWQHRDRVCAFVLLSAAMLVKGPIVYAFILPGLAAFSWRYRKDPSVVTAWCGWWPWLYSLGIFLLWVLGGMIFSPGFFHQVVVREFAERFGETVHRPQAIYFYLPHLLQKFAPWSLLGIVFLVLAWKNLRGRKIAPATFWLIAWIFGGLIVMSLIPSKRVDRIFPIIPPLCLLLGQFSSRLLAQENSRGRVLRWIAVALFLACASDAGYAAVKVASAIRQRTNALVGFGQDVRAEMQRHGWSLAVIGHDDEGLLLYLEQLHFSDEAAVIAKWNAHQIDAVVAPEEDRPILLRDLGGSIPSHIQSWRGDDKRTPHYILLTRS